MSELYELPNGWEWKKLEEIGKLFSGSSAPQNDEYFIDGKYPFVRTKDLGTNGRTDNLVEVNDYLNDKCINDSSLILAKKGTVLFPKSGASIGTNNRAQIGIDAYIVSHLGAFYSKEEVTNKYVYNYFLTIDLLDYCENPSYPSLKMSRVKDIEIPLPPLSEQQRIVSKLDLLFEKIDKSIALHQKNMDEADVFMGSVLNDVFGELEEKNHLMLRFDTYTKLSRGHNPPKKDFIYEEKDGYVRFIQIRDGSSDDNAVYVPFTKKLHLVTTDDLLLVAYRQIGKVFRNMEGAFNVALCKIENNDYSNLDTNYLYYLIQSKYVKDELLSRSERALIPSMSVDHLKSIEIPTPSLQIQQKVVKYLDEISDKIEKVKSVQKEKMDSLKALKASILDKAFRGEL